jgi:hypothetical protein
MTKKRWQVEFMGAGPNGETVVCHCKNLASVQVVVKNSKHTPKSWQVVISSLTEQPY